VVPNGLLFANYDGTQDPYNTFATSSSDMIGVLMSAASLGIPNAPYFAVILGDYLPIA